MQKMPGLDITQLTVRKVESQAYDVDLSARACVLMRLIHPARVLLVVETDPRYASS